MRSLSAKLIAGLVAGLAGVLFWLGMANLRVLRANLEATAVVTEQRMAGVIFHSTRYSMLRNDREQMLDSLKRLRALRDEGAMVVTGHDPEMWKTIPQAPALLMRSGGPAAT